jgi:acyl-CoA synthetase (AMP-forming)/AMP-acid ligase II/thioesterase domain-containing protein
LRRQLIATQEALRLAGVEPNEVVAVAMENCPELVVLCLALADRAAFALLDPSLRENEFRASLSRLKARTLVVEEGKSTPASAVAHSLGMQVVKLGARREDPAGVFTIGAPERTAPRDFGRRTDAALLAFTSATTGAPKIVPKNAEQVRVTAYCHAGVLKLGRENRHLALLPLFHAHQLHTVFGQFLAGGESIITSGFDAAAFPSWISTYRPTWYSGSAPVHRAVLALASANSDMFRRNPLRLIRSTGPVADPALLARLEQVLGAPVLDGYGTTEAGGIARNTLERRKAGSVGRAVTLEIAIMDEGGNLLPADREGEVVVRGGSVMTGYLDDPEATHAAFRNGWLLTGDLGYLDAEGFLFLSGRIKEYINRGGQKILPPEVDQVLAAHPAVAGVACFPIPHPTLGEDIAAAVVLGEGDPTGEDSLRRFASQRLAEFKVPRRIFFVAEIPRTATGKPKRGELSRRFREADDAERVSPASSSQDPLEQTIAGIWEEVLGTSSVEPDRDFFSLGGDSLSATVMLHQVQQCLGLNGGLLESVDFFGAPTVAGLARILRERGAASTAPRGASAGNAARVLAFRRGGSRAPVVCFPAVVDGLPFYLRHLAESLGAEQPFYVVAPPRIVEDNRLRTIEEVVRRSVGAVRQAASPGPYVIAGHCYGGYLAYEAAMQLLDSGEQVAGLLLFDAPAPGYPKVLRSWRRYARALGALLRPAEVVGHIRWLGRLAIRTYGGRLVRRLPAVPSGMEQANYGPPGLAMGEYAPRDIPVPVTHFLASGQHVSTRVLEDPRLAWAKWARAGFEVQLMPGDHFSMFAPENAPGLAAAVDAALTPKLRSRAGAA